MSTRAQPRCSQCGQHGHNRRTCDSHTELNREIQSALLKLPMAKKAEIGISKNVEKEPETKKFDTKPFPTCMVCMDEVCEVKNSMTLPCGHSFHVTCGVKWLQQNNSCPVCRTGCGEKIKKIPTLTPQVGMSLSQYRINSINLPGIINDIQQLYTTPWLSNKYRNELSLRADIDVSSISQVDLKDFWDELSSESKNARVTAWMIEITSTLAGRSMMDVLHDAYHYQESGSSIPGDNSRWHNEHHTMSVSFVTASELHAEEENDEENSMPELEEDWDEDEDEDDAREIHLNRMELEELNVEYALSIPPDFNTPSLDEELDAFLDAVHIADMDTVEPSTPDTSRVITPPRTPYIRNERQSPELDDRHVTRRSSERLRQRYRRRRLEEENNM